MISATHSPRIITRGAGGDGRIGIPRPSRATLLALLGAVVVIATALSIDATRGSGRVVAARHGAPSPVRYSAPVGHRYGADSSVVPSAPPSVAAPRAYLGASDGAWSAAHKLDTTPGRVLAYEAVSGLAAGATDRFADVTETNGRVSYFDLRFKPHTSLRRATRLALALLPGDARRGAFSSCAGYGLAVDSETLARELGSPKAAIYFASEGASFDPRSVTEAQVAAGESVVSSC